MHDVSVVTTDPPPSSTYRNGKLSSELGPIFYDALAEMAERLRQRIIGLVDELRFPYVSHLAQNSAIVFGVWPDSDQPASFGFHLIKGRGHVAALSGERPDERTTTAIPCVGLEQAIAAEALWGDPVPVSPSPKTSAPPMQKKPRRSPKKRSTAKRSSKRSKSKRAMRH